MKKYLYEITKGYTTEITFESVLPTGEEIAGMHHSIPWTVETGVKVAPTKKKALERIQNIIENGGNAHYVGATN